MNRSNPSWEHYFKKKQSTNQNYVSKSNPILHCFLITFSDHQKKTSLTVPTLLVNNNFFYNMFFFTPPGFSFGSSPMLSSSCTKSIVTNNSLKRSVQKKASLFLRILIRLYDLKTFLTPCTLFLKQYLNSIYIYILTYYLPAFTVTREKKKRQELEIIISRITARGKISYDKKKKKGQLRHTSWKKSRDMQSVGQKKKKNPP